MYFFISCHASGSLSMLRLGPLRSQKATYRTLKAERAPKTMVLSASWPAPHLRTVRVIVQIINPSPCVAWLFVHESMASQETFWCPTSTDSSWRSANFTFYKLWNRQSKEAVEANGSTKRGLIAFNITYPTLPCFALLRDAKGSLSIRRRRHSWL